MLKRLLAIALFFCPVLAFPQASSFQYFTQVKGPGNIVRVVPNAPMVVCNYPATGGTPCTNLVTTYIDPLTSAVCPSTAQVISPGTNVCVPNSDADGNFTVFVVAPTTIAYYFQASGLWQGPYVQTIGGTGGGGGGGSGTVTNVVGTANQIAVTNPTLVPTLSLANNTALPGNASSTGTFSVGTNFIFSGQTFTGIKGNTGIFQQAGIISGTGLGCFDASGNLTNIGCPSPTAPGSSTEVPFRNSSTGLFTSDPQYLYNSTTHTLTLNNQLITGTLTFQNPLQFTSSIPGSTLPIGGSGLAGFNIDPNGYFCYWTQSNPCLEIGTNYFGYDVRQFGAKLDGTTDDAPAIAACLAVYQSCVIPAINLTGTTKVRWASPQLIPGTTDGTRVLNCGGMGGVNRDDFGSGNSGADHTGIVSISVDMGGQSSGPGMFYGDISHGPFNGMKIANNCAVRDISSGHNSPGFLNQLNVSNPEFDLNSSQFRLAPLGAPTMPAAASILSCTSSGSGIASTSFPVFVSMAAIGPGWSTGAAAAAVSVSGANAGCTLGNCTCSLEVPSAVPAGTVAVVPYFGASSTNMFQAGLPFYCPAAACHNTAGVLDELFTYSLPGTPNGTPSIAYTALPIAGIGPKTFDHSGGFGIYAQGDSGWNSVLNSGITTPNGFANQVHLFGVNAENDNVAWDFDNKVAPCMILDAHANLNSNGNNALLTESGCLVTHAHIEGGAGATAQALITGSTSTTFANVFMESGTNTMTAIQGVGMKGFVCAGCTFGNNLGTGFTDDSASSNNLLIGNDLVGAISTQPSDIVLMAQGRYNTVPSVRYHATSAATNTNVGVTLMGASPNSNAGGNQVITGTRWIIGFYALQTAAGSGCSGTTGITASVIFTDPNASATSTIPVASFAIAGNGTANAAVPPTSSGSGATTVISSTGGYYFPSKINTNMQYFTTVTPDGSCGTKPLYSMTPILYFGGIL